jgi:predicted nucleic acid-binding Zn ribbon protein
MPVYTYRRQDGTTFDYRQKFLDEPLTTDPETGQSVVRVVQAAGIIFKGSGFYVNDSKTASRNSATSPVAATKESKEGGTADAGTSGVSSASDNATKKVAEVSPSTPKAAAAD